MLNLDAIPFIQARWFTKGRRSAPTLIVIHSMEARELSTTAEACANYFANTDRRASAHYSCDNDSTVCSVRPDDTAWHTGHSGTNNVGIGIEQAGYANQGVGWTAETGGWGWVDQYSLSMIEGQVAPLVAALCERYNIPPVFLNADELRAGNFTGITSHREITFAFVQGGHTDPGPDYPWSLLLEQVTKYLDDRSIQVPVPTPPPQPVTVYRIGSQGDKVKEIQRVVGVTPDGVYGPVTARAVAHWQTNLGIPSDGVWGPATEEATRQFFDWLSANQRPEPNGEGDAFLAALDNARKQVLRRGSTGDAVKMAQLALTLKGHGLVQDGQFGPATENAVRAFQRNNGLSADGVIGPKTWERLLA